MEKQTISHYFGGLFFQVKLRGMAQGDIVDRHFFIVLDRLHGTLDGRIKSWRRIYDHHTTFWRHVCSQKSREILKVLMIERLTVAYDLAAAFFYLHENRLVYRDIKPENIGFDIRGMRVANTCFIP